MFVAIRNTIGKTNMKTREDYDSFLAEVRKTTGIEALTPDESGLVSVRVQDEFNVNLQFVEATGKILCFIEVAELPKDAGRDVYRELLAAGLFGKETAGGYFALEPDTEIVVYNYFFDLETLELDVEEFVSSIEKILQLCEMWTGRLKELLVGIEDFGVISPDTHIHFHP